MRVYYISKLVSVSGWGSCDYTRCSPMFLSKESALRWAEENNKILDTGDYASEYILESSEVLK